MESDDACEAADGDEGAERNGLSRGRQMVLDVVDM